MNRDNLGRFTTAQHADALAAERLLERAVAEAVALLRRGPLDYRPNGVTLSGERRPRQVVYRYPNDSLARAEHILLAAAESADLLYRSAS